MLAPNTTISQLLVIHTVTVGTARHLQGCSSGASTGMPRVVHAPVQATSLRHPFIVPCVESWVVQNHTVNMIYAFCQNGDLSSYLAKVKKQVGHGCCS